MSCEGLMLVLFKDVDFICIINNGVIITINKLVNEPDLKTIKNCVKKLNNVNLSTIDSLQLSKSKSYLKIISLPYSNEEGPLIPDVITSVCCSNH